ncbi:MAG: hypothetical protein IPN11_09900 [Opitutaceae bacterium]|nr:hypothetical protein [Opitutaceae bacterium]
MKSTFTFGAALIATILLAGCDATGGVAARIQEKSAVFAQLTPEQKKNIEEGAIEYGYTTDMVYMALGKPSKVKEKAAPEGTVLMWTFNNFYPSVAVSQLAMNDPSRKYKAPPLSTNYPGEGPGGSTAASISSTKPVGPEPGVDSLGSIPSETLHVLFLDGKVFQIKLEDE